MNSAKEQFGRRNLFIEHLYNEKLKHKEHRHEFVKQKLTFIVGIFSLSFINTTFKFQGTEIPINLRARA